MDFQSFKSFSATYIVKERLGSGTHRVVEKATGKVFAAKTFTRAEHDEEGISPTTIRELSILSQLSHPFIIHVNEIVVEKDQIHMVMECGTDNLRVWGEKQRERLAKHPELIKKIARQILEALAFLHSVRIVHRDLKGHNVIVMPDETIRICDLGLGRALWCDRTQLSPEIQTLWYRAPEVMLGKRDYTEKVDVWSLGVIVASLFLGSEAFEGQSAIATLFHIFRLCGTPTEETWPGVSSLPDFEPIFPNFKPTFAVRFKKVPGVARDFLERVLTPCPERRLSAEEALGHPWFHT